jgi:hypothetical protein
MDSKQQLETIKEQTEAIARLTERSEKLRKELEALKFKQSSGFRRVVRKSRQLNTLHKELGRKLKNGQ